MQLTEHRSSTSTVQFTVSTQARTPSGSAPTLATFLDVFTSLLQSVIILLAAQWAVLQLDTNRILGPVLRYFRHLLPYKDVQIVHLNDKTWELTPIGAICILSLAVFVFFSKPTPIGAPHTLFLQKGY